MALNPVFRKFVSNGVILVHKTCLIALFRAQVRCLTGVRHVRHQQRLRQSLCRERALRRHLRHGLSHHKAYSEAPRCQLHTIIPGMFLPWKRYKFLAAVTNYGTEKQRNRETEKQRSPVEASACMSTGTWYVMLHSKPRERMERV